MRFLGFAAACVVAAAPASAAMKTVQLVGTVTQQLNPGVDPFTKLGETVTITFNYDPDTQPKDPFYNTGLLWFPRLSPTTIFKAETSGGLLWTAADDERDSGVFLDDANPLSFYSHLNRPATNNLPDLKVNNGSFMIYQSFDYGNSSPSLGFTGQLSVVQTTTVPEPATWAMMGAGLGAAGVATRRAKTRRTAAATAVIGATEDA